MCTANLVTGNGDNDARTVMYAALSVHSVLSISKTKWTVGGDCGIICTKTALK